MNFLKSIPFVFLILQIKADPDENDPNKSSVFFQKMLARRREEHLILQRNILNFDYEQKFKLLKIAIEKIFELMDENRRKLGNEENKIKKQELQMIETIIIENTCLMSDFILNFNKICYEIIKKSKIDVLEKFRWGLEFTVKYTEHLDAITGKEIEFLLENFQKIQKQEQLENPLENNLKQFEKQKPSTTPKPKKKRKTFRKGPQLTSFGEL